VASLANPIPLVAAAPGAPRPWRRQRSIAVPRAIVTALYLNEFWLAPLGARTTLALLRGLTIFAFPVVAAAGFDLAQRRAHSVPLGPQRGEVGPDRCIEWAAPLEGAPQ
jgi:hypothetical protein